jgi:hypothetical protein
MRNERQLSEWEVGGGSKGVKGKPFCHLCMKSSHMCFSAVNFALSVYKSEICTNFLSECPMARECHGRERTRIERESNWM